MTKKCKNPQCLNEMSGGQNLPDFCPDHNEENIPSTPMGVSAWEEHGKKFGYWDFFLKEATEAERNRVEKGVRNLPDKWPSIESDDYDLGYNKAKEDLLALLNEK